MFHNRSSSNYSTGIYFVVVMFSLAFIPPIIGFIYSVVKDPDTPTILKNSAAVLKDRTMGYLSKKKKATKDSNA
jgi:hypothetical protein